MFKYIFEIFCKDTTVGLCQIEKGKRKMYTFSQNQYYKPYNPFSENFFIGQTACHL